jgi:hypothetical protein
MRGRRRRVDGIPAEQSAVVGAKIRPSARATGGLARLPAVPGATPQRRSARAAPRVPGCSALPSPAAQRIAAAASSCPDLISRSGTARAPRQLLKVAARRSIPGQSGHCPGAGRSQASMSRIKIQGPPGGCWRRPARKAGVTSAWITAASLEWAGDERGQDADPPVHAVRVRDVLQLDGLRALLGALRTKLICL